MRKFTEETILKLKDLITILAPNNDYKATPLSGIKETIMLCMYSGTRIRPVHNKINS